MKYNNQHSLLKISVLGLVWMVAALPSLGQNMLPFPKVIEQNTTLDSGIYAVKGNNIVRSNATLTIVPGTALQFAENAVIQIQGGLVIQGKPGDFVHFTSIDESKPGMGFVVHQESERSITVDYAHFETLKKPLKFGRYWLRSGVDITHSMFRNHHDGVYMEILEIDKILIDKSVVVNIEHNTFGNNTGSMMISDAAWDQLHMNIRNNVYSRNEFIGRELNGIFTTPLFINYNEATGQLPQPTIENNSISYNYVGLIAMDTVEFLPVYLTAVGSADKLNISKNYFGINAEKYLIQNSEIIHSSQRAPFIEFSNPMEKPLESNNGHIYKIGVNGVEVDNPNYDLHIDQFTEVIELIGNKPALPSPEYDVTYIYIDDDTIRRYQIKHRLEFLNGNLKTKIYLDDKILKKYENGYIEVKGLVDQNGFIFPTVNIGLKNFLNEHREFLVNMNDYMAIPRITVTNRDYYITLDSNISDKSDTNVNIDETDILVNRKYWEFEVTTGSTVYFGDLVTSSVSIYIPNSRPHLGFRFGYNFNEKWKVQLRQNSLIIAGDDKRETTLGKIRGTNYERGLSVRTTIIDAGISAVFTPLKHRKISSLIPSFNAGISGFYFNPQAKYNGQYYNLRPIGTEGQTLDGSKEAYGKFAFSIPVGMQMERHINQKFVLGIAWTYHKLFFDYLDDVSVGRYPEPEALKAVNPDLGDIAVKLSNPNDQTGQRSYSPDNDGFGYFGITARWKL